MRALTVKCPYAWAIGQGYKTIENRRWVPKGGRADLFIHCGRARSMVDEEIADVLVRLGDPLVAELGGVDAVRAQMTQDAGVVVARVSVEVVGSHRLTLAEREWWAGPDWFAWRLTVIERYPLGRRVFSGKQGLWNIPTKGANV